jgi:hypothetical protein
MFLNFGNIRGQCKFLMLWLIYSRVGEIAYRILGIQSIVRGETRGGVLTALR